MKLPTILTALLAFAQTAAVLYHLREYAFQAASGITDEEGQQRLLNACIFHGVMGLLTVVSVAFVTAPYGRHAPTSWVKLSVDTRAAWILQEMPTLISVVVGLLPLLQGQDLHSIMTLFFNGQSILTLPLLCFVAHYTHRTLIFPFMLRPRNDTPIHVMLLANLYCCFNGWLQISSLTRTGPVTDNSAVAPHVSLLSYLGQRSAEEIAGVVIFLVGMSINMWADYTLIGLRKNKNPVVGDDKKKKCPAAAAPTSEKSNYVIPRGGLFEFVSCPNFLGECIEWLGYTLAVIGAAGDDSHFPYAPLAAFTFFIYTGSNTIPRAFSHHAWYKKTFGWEYEKLNRSVVVPFLM